jgi:hypothetical protein
MKIHIIVLTAIILIIPLQFHSQFKEHYSKETEYQKLTNEQDYWVNSPWILNDAIIFFYKDKANKILVGGDFNDWKPELLMDQKNTNFWQYVWEERLPKGRYKYKLMVDDIWISDPYNSNIIIDDSGQPVSYFELKEDFIPNASYPLWLEKDIFQFKYEDTSAKNISLVGDFNNWNPYSTPLKNFGAGEFSINIRLMPGIHSYCFVVDDEWKADPNNLNQYSDKVGTIISIIFVKDKNNKNPH